MRRPGDNPFLDWILPLGMIAGGGAMFLLNFNNLFFDATGGPTDGPVQAIMALFCFGSAVIAAVGVIWIGVLPVVFAVRRISQPPPR